MCVCVRGCSPVIPSIEMVNGVCVCVCVVVAVLGSVIGELGATRSATRLAVATC